MSWFRPNRRVEKLTVELEPSGAVSQRLGGRSHPIQERQPKIHERGALFIPNMTARIERRAAAPGQQDRQVVVVVTITVGIAAAVGNQAIVQQRSFSFLDGLEFLQQISELLDVKPVDGAQLALFGRVVLVMREVVMPVADVEEARFAE